MCIFPVTFFTGVRAEYNYNVGKKSTTKMEDRFHVFADSAGTLRNSEDPVIVLATLVVSESEFEAINGDFISLKNKVARWGINTGQPKFEFHTSDIFQGSKDWRRLSEVQRMEVLKDLKATLTPRMPFAMVVIHKDYGGKRALDRFHKSIKPIRKEVLSLLSEDLKNELESRVQQPHKKKGFGPLGEVTGLLFGLTTSLMHWENIRCEAEVTIDEQFVKQVEGWELLFMINAVGWPELAKRNLFELWPKGDQPDWHLGCAIHPEESYKRYGLQMVDFIAYTTKLIRRNPLMRERHSIGVVANHDFVPFCNYRGIDLVVSHRTSRKKLIRASAVRGKKTHPYIRRKTSTF